MRLKVKKINFETGHMKDVVLNYLDAAKLDKKAGERVIIKNVESKNLDEKYWVAIIQISHSDNIVAPGELGVFVDTLNDIKNLRAESEVSVKPANPPDSYQYIKEKIAGKKLRTEDINDIVNDAVSGLLSRIELSSFITSVSIHGMSNREMKALTLAEAKSGEAFDFGPNVYDKHST